MNIDWGKIIGSAIAAGLIALQVGMNAKLETHEEATNRNIQRVEDTTMHKDTVRAHADKIDARFTVMEKEVMPRDEIESLQSIINTRLLQLEREVNSLYFQEEVGSQMRQDNDDSK